MRYDVITPANNEQAFIHNVLESVCARTHTPAQWTDVIADPTDGTDALAKRYAIDFAWIQLVYKSPVEFI